MKKTTFFGLTLLVLFTVCTLWMYWGSPVHAKYRDAINFEDNQFTQMHKVEVLHRFTEISGSDPVRFDRSQLDYRISYGFFTNYELGVNLPVLFYENGEQGVGDLSVFQRFKFLEGEGSHPGLSGGVEFILPTGSDDDNPPTGTDELNFRFFGTVSHSFAARWKGLFNAGYVFYGQDEIDEEFQYNVGLRHQTFRRVKLLGELNGETGGRPDNTELYLSPGVVFQPREGFSATFSVPVGLSNDSADHRMNAQLVFEF